MSYPTAEAANLVTYKLNVYGCTGGRGVNGQNSTNNVFGSVAILIMAQAF